MTARNSNAVTPFPAREEARSNSMPPSWLQAPASPPLLFKRILPPASPPSPIKPLPRLEPGPSPEKLPLRAPVKRKGARGARPQAAGPKRRCLSPLPPTSDSSTNNPPCATSAQVIADVPQDTVAGTGIVGDTGLESTCNQSPYDTDITDAGPYEDHPTNNDAPDHSTNNDAFDSTPLEREPNEEDMYTAFMQGVDGEFVSFIRIMRNWCVVQGWDSSRRRAVVRMCTSWNNIGTHLRQPRWYHLQFARIGDKLSVSCKCPMSDHIRTMCVHEQYLREFEAYFSDEEPDDCALSPCVVSFTLF